MFTYEIKIPKIRFKEVPDTVYRTNEGELIQGLDGGIHIRRLGNLERMASTLVEVYEKTGYLDLPKVTVEDLINRCNKELSYKEELALYDESDKIVMSSCMGVYIFYSEKGTVLYVGKSENLKSRVQAHIGGNGGVKGLAETQDSFTFIPLDNPHELSFVECELIKTLKPRLNKMMADYDKEQASDCGDGEWIDSVVASLKKTKKELLEEERQRQIEENLENFRL